MSQEMYRTSIRETEGIVDRAMRILLCHSNPRDRDLLADRLDRPDQTVVFPEDDGSLPRFDLCVADVAALRTIGDEIAARRRELRPVHVPVLLILGPRDSEAAVGPALERVDDVIEVPTSADVFSRRVDALLQIRRQSEQLALFGRAMDDATAGISIAEADGDQELQYVNDAFVEITGYNRAEALGRNCRFLQGPGTDPEPVRQLREAIDNRESVTVELRNYRKDGSLFWNHVEISPVYGEHGVTHFVGFQQDITERVERTRALAQYEEIVEAAADPIYALDSELRFTLVNDATVELGDTPESEILGDRVESVFGTSHAEVVAEAVLELTDSGTHETTIETVVSDAGSRPRRYQTVVSVLPGDGFEGVVCVSRDITADRERESRLSVLDRVLRHNLRNKLLVMMAQVERIQKETDEATVTESAAAIERAGEQLLSLADTAREFKETVDPDSADTVGPVDVGRTTARAVEETRLEYPETRFVTTVPESLWASAHDSVELAITELLDRAARSGEGVEVTVRLTEDEDVATLRVTHDGTGLDQVELDALNAGAESDLQHTSGLGLWFVRWMAINSDGSFTIADNDLGTVVELTLPLAEPPAQ